MKRHILTIGLLVLLNLCNLFADEPLKYQSRDGKTTKEITITMVEGVAYAELTTISYNKDIPENWHNATTIEIEDNGSFSLPAGRRFFWISFTGVNPVEIMVGGQRSCDCYGESSGVCEVKGIGCTNTQSCQEECHWGGTTSGGGGIYKIPRGGGVLVEAIRVEMQ